MVECALCGEEIESEVYYGDEGAFYASRPLCEACYYEDEACALVYYKEDVEPKVISSTRNETGGDFSVEWHSTDAWRGYYETKSQRYALVNTAELLAYHESEEMLKDFDKRIRELFNEHGIDYARVFARSSNIFYQNYDLYVRKEQLPLASLLVAKAKAEVDYYNPRWYRNIVFDESVLKRLSELFPETKISTDSDALRLIVEMGDEILGEIGRRLRADENER
jgi:hypothetical protein